MVARLFVCVGLLALVAWPERHVPAYRWYAVFEPGVPAEVVVSPGRMFGGIYFTVENPCDLAEEPISRVYGAMGGRAGVRARLRLVCPDEPPDYVEELVERVVHHERYRYRDAGLEVVLDVIRDALDG